MKHDPLLAHDLLIRSLEAKVARLESRIAALEKRPKPRRAKIIPPTDRDALKSAPILDRAARMHGCTVAEICGSRGSKRVCKARAEAAYDCLQAGLSSIATGRVLGGRDHSTALHLAARHKERMGL